VRILREIAARGPAGMRAPELAVRIGLERPTVYRILKGLVAQRMLFQDSASKCFCLGALIYELGLAAEPQLNLRGICRETLSRLAQETGDCVFLLVRSGLESVCIDREAGSFPVKALTLDIGARRPLGVGAGSLALVLTFPPEEIERVIAANTMSYGAYGHFTPERLRAALVRSRRAGYAINDEDVMDGVSGIGLGIRPDGHSPALAAISISGITTRISGARRKDLATLLRQSVRGLERRLGAEIR